MNNTQQFILLENARFYAYHGVYEQEKCIGNWFEVSLKIKTDLSHAMQTDEIGKTISYAEVHDLIAEEMSIPSNLLEHLAGRIMQCLQTHFKTISFIELKVSKLHPPMKGEVAKAGVLLIWEKEKS